MFKITIFYGLLSYFTLFSIVMLPWSRSLVRSELVTCQFGFIGFMAIYFMIRECRRHSFSLMMMHWFFVYVFFFCAGLTQFANNSYMWNLYPSINTNIYANYLIIIWEITAVLASCVNLKRNVKNIEDYSMKEYSAFKCRVMIMALLLCIIGLYPLLKNGVISYFSRDAFGKSTLTSLVANISIKLVLDSMIVGFCLWCVLIAIRHYKPNLISKVILFLSIIALLLNVPPLGLPRFEIAAVYGGILLYNCEFVKKNNSFIIILIVGLFFIFPMLNTFRNTAGNDIDLNTMLVYLGNVDSNFMRADYDAYTMLLYSVEYVRFFGYSYGYQLLGVLLFYIPSVFWNNKPGGSGSMIINDMTIGVDGNVSCPIVAEGFLNFGVIGVIIFCIIFTSIIKKFDSIYWNNYKASSIKMLYCCSVPFILFIMRGDLMSTSAFYSGFYASLYIYRKLFLEEIS